MFNLVRPFTLATWAGLLASLWVMPWVILVMARAEISSGGAAGSSYWGRLGNAAWYTYGTFMGESITRTVRWDNAQSVRCRQLQWVPNQKHTLNILPTEL